MSMPISASTVWATLSAKPGISFSRSAALRNGASAASIRASNSAIVASICSIDQMLTDQEAMMVAQASVERCGNSAAGAGELLRVAEFGQPSRIALAGHDRLQDASAPEAQDVGNDRGQVDVGFLRRRLKSAGCDGRSRASARAACGSGCATPGSVAAAQSWRGSARGQADPRSRSRRSRRSCGPASF